MVIPPEAVEAAAKAAYEVMPVELLGRGSPVTWEQLGDSVLGQHHKDQELAKARAALEAAAPHIRAQVLEEAADAAEDPSPEDMDSYFIDQSDVGRWLRDRVLK